MDIVTGLVTTTGPRKVKAKGAFATLKVGVFKPSKNETSKSVFCKTTLVSVVTLAENVLDSLLAKVKVLSGDTPPTTPCRLMAAVFPPFKRRLRVLALSPSTVFANVNWPAACKLTSVNNFRLSLNIKSVLVRMDAPLRCVSPKASVLKLVSAVSPPTTPSKTVVPLSRMVNCCAPSTDDRKDRFTPCNSVSVSKSSRS